MVNNTSKINSQFLSNDIKMKELHLELEPNEKILDCIKEGFKKYNISKGEVINCEGFIKNFSLNYFQKSSLKNVKIINEKKIIMGIGEFKYNFIDDKIYGRLRIAYKDYNKVFDGILLNGKAGKSFKIIIRYLEDRL